MRNLLRLLAARNRLLVLASAALLGGFEILICGIATTLDLDNLLREVMSTAPPFFSAMIGEQFGELTLRGVLAFGWNHPVALAIGAAAAIVLGSRAVAGEIEEGAVELLMTQPISRMRYYVGQALFGAAVLAVVTLAGAGGTLAGQKLYDLEPFGVRELALLVAGYWLLNLAWFAIALAFSARGREGGAVATAVFFVALASYLVNAVGSVLDSLAFALPFSLFSWFSPRGILVGQEAQVLPLTVLALVTLAAAISGAIILHRRDLP